MKNSAPQPYSSRSQKRQLGRLIGRVARQDQDALAELCRRAGSLVDSTVWRILHNREAAEEAAQDVYLQIWQKAASFDPSRGNPCAWIVMLARSRAIDHLRREKQFETLDAEGALQSLPAAEDPEAESLRSEVRGWIASALKRLSPEQRTVIEHAYFGGLSHREIASRLRIPLGTIKTRIRSAVRRMHSQLQPLHTGS